MDGDETPEGVKDCLKTIIFEAANEAGLPLGGISLVRSTFPNIIEALPKDYGSSIYHSLHAILIYYTSAFKDFHEQRLDENTCTTKPLIVPEENLMTKKEKEMKTVEITIYTNLQCEKGDTSELARLLDSKSCQMASSLFHLIEISCMNYEQMPLGEADSKLAQEHLESIRIIAELGKQLAYQI
jgi:hypothetical protein